MLTGRVDEVRDRVVYGWAADPDRPNKRAEIRVVGAGRQIGSALADVLRRDLAAGQLGDGRHAFQIEIDDMPPDGGLQVFAALPGEAEVELTVANETERHLERLFDLFSRRYETSLRTLHAQQVKLQEHIADGPDAAVSPAALEAVEARIAALDVRLDEVDLFLLRIDTTLRAIDERSRAPARRGLVRRLLGLAARR